VLVERKAVQVLVDFARRKLGEATIDEQVLIYQALSKTMPTHQERAQAAEIAQTLSRVAALQMDFSKQLFTELQWPGTQHNGPKKGGK
jgi:hypothetical protein